MPSASIPATLSNPLDEHRERHILRLSWIELAPRLPLSLGPCRGVRKYPLRSAIVSKPLWEKFGATVYSRVALGY